jgi:hypothetical protein
MVLKRVVIYAEDRGDGIKSDLGVLRSLINKANGRFFMRKVTVEKLMMGSATESDLYYLNDFNVYGDLGVIFTDETSYGLPLTSILSRHERDVMEWKTRFEELWDLATEVNLDLGEDERGERKD